SDPRGDGLGLVAGHLAGDAFADVAATAGVHPEDARPDRDAPLVDGDGARPLAGDADGDDVRGVDGATGDALAGGVGDQVPPLVGVLLGPAAVDPGRGELRTGGPRDLP